MGWRGLSQIGAHLPVLPSDIFDVVPFHPCCPKSLTSDTSSTGQFSASAYQFWSAPQPALSARAIQL